MATQRITLLKYAGVAGDEILRRLMAWSAARVSAAPLEWGEEQWPKKVRRDADELVKLLKTNAMQPPCLFSVEWLDTWSMFDQFHHWLIPAKPQQPIVVYGNRYQVHAYALPDGGRLKRRLAKAGKQQFEEYHWLATRLREAIRFGENVIDRAALILIREVLGGSLDDSELDEPLANLPAWLAIPTREARSTTEKSSNLYSE